MVTEKIKVTFYARVGNSEIFNEIDSIDLEPTREPEVITDANRLASDHITATSRVSFNLLEGLKALVQKMEA